MLSNDADGLIIILFMLSLLIALPLSVKRGKEWKESNPDKRPYAWGYFQSLSWITSLVAVPFVLISGLGSNSTDAAAQGIVLSIFLLLGGTTGYFMYRRRRWAWIVGIILAANPILWIINIIYLVNRWSEMAEPFSATPPTAVIPSDTYRALIASSYRTSPPSAQRIPSPAITPLPAPVIQALSDIVYLFDQDETIGPYHMDQVRAMWQSGLISADTLVCPEGDTSWQTLLPHMTV